jgi:predicted membrane GTPase involved in stress response
MAKEPDDLVLRLLREIRAKQDEHTRLLEEHSTRFTQLDARLDELNREMTYALGLGTRAVVKDKEQDTRLNDLFSKVEQLLSDNQRADS